MKDKLVQSIAILGGGTHVHPMLGRQTPISTLKNYTYDISRDINCLELLKRRKHALGICRGFQFLSLYHGGKLNQDNGLISGIVEMSHCIPSLGTLDVPTDHSQSVISVGKGLAIAMYKDSIYAAIWSNDSGGYDIGVQFHPEWSKKGSDVHRWMDNLTMSFFETPFDFLLPHIVSN